MRKVLASAIAASLVSVPTHAQHPKETESRVPFIGCPSDGQLGPQAAPKSRRTPVLPSASARQLAFYAASDGPGVLAPRGWHCFGVYGSNGSGLVVAPQKLIPREFFSQHQFRTNGYGVELAYDYGGTSGRWAVAEAIARYFPRHRSFIQENFHGLEVGPLPSGPYAHDSFSSRTDTLVRYTTPPRTKGEGTVWMLAPSSEPVEGLSMLVNEPDGPDLLRVNVRLPVAYKPLTSVILANAERAARQDHQLQGMSAAHPKQRLAASTHPTGVDLNPRPL